VFSHNNAGVIAIKRNGVVIGRGKFPNTTDLYKTAHVITYHQCSAGFKLTAKCIGSNVRCLKDTSVPHGLVQFSGFRVA